MAQALVAKKTTVGKAKKKTVGKAPCNVGKEALQKCHRLPTACYSPMGISVSTISRAKKWVLPKCQVTQRMEWEYLPDKITARLKLNLMGDDDFSCKALDQCPDKKNKKKLLPTPLTYLMT
jgi:hypothetical protein